MFIGKKPQTSTCVCSRAELDYNYAVHCSAFTATLTMPTILHLPAWKTLYLSKTLLYNTADFLTPVKLWKRKALCFENWWPWAAKKQLLLGQEDAVKNYSICIDYLTWEEYASATAGLAFCIYWLMKINHEKNEIHCDIKINKTKLSMQDTSSFHHDIMFLELWSYTVPTPKLHCMCFVSSY